MEPQAWFNPKIVGYQILPHLSNMVFLDIDISAQIFEDYAEPKQGLISGCINPTTVLTLLYNR